MNVTSYNKATLDTLLAGKATPAQITAAITQLRTDLLAGAPGALDTLNELAAALGNDQNYAATITTALNARPTAVQVAATTVTFTDINGNPITGKHVQVRLTADLTDIDNIVVVSA